MPKGKILYEEESTLIAKYHNPGSNDYLDYGVKIVIKDSGKTPVQVKLKFEGMEPSFAPMPLEQHTIKATDIIQLGFKLAKWLKKYGYEQV